MKLDSAFIKLCVCVKKSNFLSWAIRTVFVDPVTFHEILSRQYSSIMRKPSNFLLHNVQIEKNNTSLAMPYMIWT